MNEIFDRDGKVVAWRLRQYVFDPGGAVIAFVRERCLHTTEGRFAGHFEDGWYRDPSGRPVACEANASGGPIPPIHERGAIAPPNGNRAVQPAFEAPPRVPMRRLEWSALDFVSLARSAASRPVRS